MESEHGKTVNMELALDLEVFKKAYSKEFKKEENLARKKAFRADAYSAPVIRRRHRWVDQAQVHFEARIGKGLVGGSQDNGAL